LSIALVARCCAALILSCLSVQAALADDPKPDATIKTKAIEANVFLDARIKADAALAADCLADDKKNGSTKTPSMPPRR
jgi:hypothetical protein